MASIYRQNCRRHPHRKHRTYPPPMVRALRRRPAAPPEWHRIRKSRRPPCPGKPERGRERAIGCREPRSDCQREETTATAPPRRVVAVVHRRPTPLPYAPANPALTAEP
eukprot:scaffold5717_cov112-Isochrysis_galbana.AAC.10